MNYGGIRMRHDEPYLKRIHDHYSHQQTVVPLLKKLPFFYFGNVSKPTKTHNFETDGLSIVLDRDTFYNKIPFFEFSYVNNMLPVYHNITVDPRDGTVVLLDFYDPEKTTKIESEEDIVNELLGMGTFLDKNPLVVQRNSINKEGKYELTQYSYRRGKLSSIIFTEDYLKSQRYEHIFNILNTHYKNSFYDFCLEIDALLSIFTEAEDKHLVSIRDAPIIAPPTTGHQQQKKSKVTRYTSSHHYVYLDAPPARVLTKEQQDEVTHTKRSHARRAHWRILSHPRFKNHPDYGKRIRIKATWVGPDEWVDQGKIYTVHNHE